MSELKQLEMVVVARALQDAGFQHVDRSNETVTAEVATERDAAAPGPQMTTEYVVSVEQCGNVNLVRTRTLQGTAREATVGGVVPVRVCGHSEDVTEFVTSVENVQDLMAVIAWVRNERGTGTVPNATRRAERAAATAVATG